MTEAAPNYEKWKKKVVALRGATRAAREEAAAS